MALNLRSFIDKLEDDEGLFQQGKFVPLQRAKSNFNTLRKDPSNFIVGNAPKKLTSGFTNPSSQINREAAKSKVAWHMSRSSDPSVSSKGADLVKQNNRLQLNRAKATGSAFEGIGVHELAQRFPKNKVFNFLSSDEDRNVILKGMRGEQLSPDEQRLLDQRSIFSVGGLSGGVNAIGGKQQIAKKGFSLLTDKKPRFEIDDSSSRLLLPKDISGKVYSVKQVLGHDELYKRYPQLADTPITAAKLEPTVDAMWDGSKIVLNENFLRNPSKKTVNVLRPNGKVQKLNFERYVKAEDKIRATVLHELQHAIQDVEGFAKGGNPSTAKSLSIQNADKRALIELKQELLEEAKKTGDTRLVGSGFTESDNPLLKSKIQEVKNLERKVGEKPLDSYNRLSGEVEARDVMARMNLTPDQRVRIQPLSSQGIPVKDQIVKLENDSGFSQSADKARLRRTTAPGQYTNDPRLDNPLLPDVDDLNKQLGDVEKRIFEARDARSAVDQQLDVFGPDQMRAIGQVRSQLSRLEKQGRDITNVTETKAYKTVIDDVMANLGLRSEDEAIEAIMNMPNRVSGASKADISKAAQLRAEINRLNKSHSSQKVDQVGFDRAFDEADDILFRTPDDIAEEARKVEFAVDKKVNLVDYLRTPEHVLKKLGLDNEAAAIRKGFENYQKDLRSEIQRIDSWKERAPSREASQRIFKWLDGQKGIELEGEELKVAQEIKSYLSDWADNLGLPEDKRIAHYITHIFEKDFIQKEFDPDIAKLISDRVPGSVYDPFLSSRLGKRGYIEDVWGALDAYVKRATRKSNMDPALNMLSDAADQQPLENWNYIKRYADRINMRPTEIDNLLDNMIKQVAGYRFGQRPTTVLTKKFRQMIYRSTLGLNPQSALKNISQGANTYAELGEQYTYKGYKSLVTEGTDELYKVGVLDDNIIQDRRIGVYKTFLEKADPYLFWMFDQAEKINRGSAYYGAKAKALANGASEEEAIRAGIDLVRKTQFTFGSIDTPVALGSDIAKLLTQLQSFTLKQGEFLGGKIKQRDIKGIARYIGATLLFAGSVGKLIGFEPKDAIPSFRFESPFTQMLQTPGDIIDATSDDPLKSYEGKKNLRNNLFLIPPAGIQMKKTFGGLKSVIQGASTSDSGRVRTPVAQSPSNLVRGALFGEYKLPEVREYFDKDRSVLGENQSQDVLNSSDPQGEYMRIIENREADNEEEPSLMDRIKISSGINMPEPAEVQAAELPTDKEDLKTIYKESIKIANSKKDTQEKIRLGLASDGTDPIKVSGERGEALVRIRQIKQQYPELIFEADVETYSKDGPSNVTVEDRAEWAANTLGAAESEEDYNAKLEAMYEGGVMTKSVVEALNEQYDLNISQYTSGGKRKSLGGGRSSKGPKVTIATPKVGSGVSISPIKAPDLPSLVKIAQSNQLSRQGQGKPSIKIAQPNISVEQLLRLVDTPKGAYTLKAPRRSGTIRITG